MTNIILGRKKTVFALCAVILFSVAIWHNTSYIAALSATGSTVISGVLHKGEEIIPDTPTIDFNITTPFNVPSPLNHQAQDYFEQAFSLNRPRLYPFSALSRACNHAQWKEGDVYLDCSGINAGMTSIMSQVKVCFKMAIEGGVGLLLPTIPLRDSVELGNFNMFNASAQHTYDEWFDVNHFIRSTERSCPQLKVLSPKDLPSAKLKAWNEEVVENKWTIDLAASGWQIFKGFFWVGRPFKVFFDEQYQKLTEGNPVQGLTTISIATAFLSMRITDDPTGSDLQLWTDLAHLMRFTEKPRAITNAILSHIDRPFYGVHFRVERDNMWSSIDHQLEVDLEALDTAWTKYGARGEQKPLVYLACGDQEQIKKFQEAAGQRGWEVTDKWQLAQQNPEVVAAIDALAFDFQGAVDMGVMLQSHFFIGLQGSAFSSTIGNARDATGKYRGSSFQVDVDESARTHLFNDGDGSEYACCL